MPFRITLLLAFALSLTGCATRPDRLSMGTAIIIATEDSRHAGTGKMVSDNAANMPSKIANIGGAGLGTAGGIAADAGVAAAVNIVGGEWARSKIPFQVKMLYEKDCSIDTRTVFLSENPEASKLVVGYLAQWVPADDGKDAKLIPLLGGDGQQRYLTKNHPCYKTWVDEWKLFQKAGWSGARVVVKWGKSDQEIPDPDIEWVK